MLISNAETKYILYLFITRFRFNFYWLLFYLNYMFLHNAIVMLCNGY